MTEKLFKESIAYLCAMFNRQLSDEIIRGYWTALKDLSDDEFKNSVENILKDFSPTAACPFPVPAHFMRYHKSRDYSGIVETVKEKVRGVGSWVSVDFQDRALHYVIKSYGGWAAICSWTDEDWQINTKHFIEAYRSAVEQKKCGPVYIAGTNELNNRATGYAELADAEIPVTVDRRMIENKMQPEVRKTLSDAIGD